MNNVIKKILSIFTFNRICIGLFLILYIGFYYSDYMRYITLSYIALIIGFVFNLLKSNGMKHIYFILITLMFLVYSSVSVLWAPASGFSNAAIVQLMKVLLVVICFINLINDRKDVKFAFLCMSIGGLIYALLYLLHIDISMLGDDRIASEDNDLPNVNTVALILSFSFSYFIFIFFKKYNLFCLLGALMCFVVIFILGARKTIISLFLCLFLLFIKLDKKNRIGLGILCIVSFICVLYIIPPDYLNFVIERMSLLNVFSSDSQENLNDSGDDLRLDFIIKGVYYFLMSPILGHGYYSFSQLYGGDTGNYMYSHNNYIETLVGGGVIAFVLYYSIHYKIGKRLLSQKVGYDYGFLMIMQGVILLFNHFTIVVLQERFIWLLLALMWTSSFYYKRNPF